MKNLIITFALLFLFDRAYAQDNHNDENILVKHELDSLFYGGIDLYDNVVNLTPNSNPEESVPIIRLDDYQDGFMVYHGLEHYIGIGPAISWFFENATGLTAKLWGYVGLALAREKSVEFSSYVKSKEDIKETKKRKKIPYKVSEFDSWEAGDSVYFHSLGGLAFTAKLGMYDVGIGNTFVISGGWQTYIEKISDGKVFVNLAKNKFEKGYLSIGSTIAEVSEGYVKELSKGFSFVFDLHNSQAAMAYEDFIRGNIAPTQEIASDQMNPPIIHVNNTFRKKLAKFKRFFLGIPFINISHKKEKYLEHRKVIHHGNGDKTEAIYAANYKQTFGRVIHRHRIRTQGFFSGLKTEKTNDNVEKTTFFGKFGWHYFSDHSSAKKLRRALKKLIGKTGLDKLAVIFPDENKLKHASIDFSLNIPQAYIEHLLTFNIDNNLSDLKREAYNGISSHLSNSPYRDFECGEKNHSNCKKEVESIITESISKMRESLYKLKHLLILDGLNDVKSKYEFTRELNKFGKLATDNRYLLKALYLDGQKCGVSYEYVIQGFRLSRHHVKEKGAISKSCQQFISQ